MGLLVIDHRGGLNPDGTPGDLKEFDTIPCLHCGAVIAILLKGFSREYQGKFRCDRCRGSICRACAKNMEVTKECNPLKARIEHAVKKGAWDEQFQYQWRQS